MSTNGRIRLQEVAACIEYLKGMKKKGDSDATQRIARLRSSAGRKEAIEQIYISIGTLLKQEHFSQHAHFSNREERVLLEVAALQAGQDTSVKEHEPFSALLSAYFPPEAESSRRPIERRFTALLHSPVKGISKHLKPLILIMKGKKDGVTPPINWTLLYQDLLYWESPKREVQKKWARQFFKAEARLSTESTKGVRNGTD